MPMLEHGKNKFTVDNKGYLVGGPDVVNDDWIDYVKSDVGIVEMTQEHWEIFNNVQDYLRGSDGAISIRELSRAAQISLKKIYELFIYPGKGLCKMAGSNCPTSCNVGTNF